MFVTVIVGLAFRRGAAPATLSLIRGCGSSFLIPFPFILYCDLINWFFRDFVDIVYIYVLQVHCLVLVNIYFIFDYELTVIFVILAFIRLIVLEIDCLDVLSIRAISAFFLPFSNINQIISF